MRLIDADVLIQYLKTLQAINREDVLYCEDLEDFIDHIEELPTAYDIDKVVEQLEDCKTKKYVSGITHNPYEFGACHAMDDAIEIVKKGGAE